MDHFRMSITICSPNINDEALEEKKLNQTFNFWSKVLLSVNSRALQTQKVK